MRIKYLNQQLFSHFSVVLLAFLILSFIFSQFMEDFVYQNKTDELHTYGGQILLDMEQTRRGAQPILSEYSRVLEVRDIQFSLFDENARIIYTNDDAGPDIKLQDSEWNKITQGETVVVKRDFKRFNVGVTYVLLPYFHQERFIGGILLTSPIKGLSVAIEQINRYLFYTVLIAFVISLLLSWWMATFHVNRIKSIQRATSQVASGDYTIQIPAKHFDEIGELARDFNRMVEKLKKSMEEIDSLEQRRRQFMADVSHELRTPLTTINGVIEGIETGMIPETEREKAMNLARKETKRLIRLVNENLDYEKIRSNQVALHKEEIQVQEVFEIIRDQLEMMAGEKGNEIKIDVEAGLHIYADYDRLIQVLINITKNSIQFTTDGEIILRGRNVGRNTVIEIEDTGVGINPDDMERIWQRFYKAGLSRSNNPYGEFGLGLSIVKQLVKLHEGDIKVSSVAEEGTVFTIIFPNNQ